MKSPLPPALWRLLLRHRTWVVVPFQAFLVLCALVLAWFLRFEFTLPQRQLLLSAVPLLIPIRMVCIGHFDLMKGWWRFAGVRDAIAIVKAVFAGSIAFWLVFRVLLGGVAFPRSVYFLEAVLTASALAGARLLVRSWSESMQRCSSRPKRVLLIGAGCAAETVLRELTRPDSGFLAVGCVDDDESKSGLRLHGVPVLGNVEALPHLACSNSTEEILIVVPSATGEQMRRFVDLCTRAGVPYRTVPALRDVLSGQVGLHEFREVKLDDLLGREPAKLNLRSARTRVESRVVLVTGAAGSIGSELCRQILDCHPARLIAVDRSETAMFYLCSGLAGHPHADALSPSLADICDVRRMRRLFAEHRPDFVFHAAAYKHVPLMELNPAEAVANNVFALPPLLSAAEEAGCRKFVFISSDKAVNPTSVMGATKRAGELILSSWPAARMHCVSVRFGNVLGSNGSLIPILQEQLRKNLPLTITHPGMKRFFMTIGEAVALVLQAFAAGERGDILVLDMGTPVSILALAQSLIQFSGYRDKEVTIRFTGLREGEKLEEELFYETEDIRATSCERIKRVRGAVPSWFELQRRLEELELAVRLHNAAAVRDGIRRIVPEFSPLPTRPSGDSRLRILHMPLRPPSLPADTLVCDLSPARGD